MGKTQATTPSTPEQSPWTFNQADRLEKALEVAGVSHAEMAEALDVSRNTIGNYTSGRTVPSKLQMREWSMRTGAPLAWLEEGDVGLTRLERVTFTVEDGRLAEIIPIRKVS